MNDILTLESNEQKKLKNIKNSIKEKKKQLTYYVTIKNMYMKRNDINGQLEAKEKIKELNYQINSLQNAKKELEKPKEIVQKIVKKKKTKKVEINLSNEELDLLNERFKDNHLEILTNFNNIDITLLEHLLQLKQKYIFYIKQENKKVKKIKKSIAILSDFNSENKLDLELNKEQSIRKILKKIINYLDELIRLEYKKINSINRKEKRLIETVFAEKYGIQNISELKKEYNVNELYSTYYQLIFKDKEMNYINDLLEKFPDLYLLRKNKRAFYEDILDKYSNILLNKNFTNEKSKNNYIEVEYYRDLICKYLTYSFENNNSYIQECTIKKIERVLYLINQNEIYSPKSKIILNELSYLKEIIKLGTLTNNNTYNVKEISSEYVFSVDSEHTKVIEDAISVKKEDNYYFVNIYTPDLASFIPINSILESKALERYKRNNYSFKSDIVGFFKLVQGRKKRVIGYHFLFDMDGNLVDLKIEKNIIKLYKTYTFSEVSLLLRNKSNQNINILGEIYEKIDNKSLEKIDYSSSTILSNMIVDLGSILGKYLNTRNIPCLYKHMNDGKVYNIPDDYYYIEFTSPLRSYLSYFNQRAVLEQKYVRTDDICSEINTKIEKQKTKKYNN